MREGTYTETPDGRNFTLTSPRGTLAGSTWCLRKFMAEMDATIDAGILGAFRRALIDDPHDEVADA